MGVSAAGAAGAGSIVIRLQTDPAPAGVAWSYSGVGQAFQLRASGSSRTISGLADGTYRLVEAAAAGQAKTLTSLKCADPSGGTTVDVAAATATIVLSSGETVTCTFTHYRPDGSLAVKALSPSPQHVQQVKAQAAAIAARIRQNPPVAPQYDAKRFHLFEHLLAYMNARGERPVIVFNPLYPTVYAELERFGNPVITSSLNYLHSLRSRYDFVVVDCENSHTWGGTDYDWKNATHVDQFNMRRMLRYIAAHSGGALR
jgi:hypothetical protein